MMLDRKTVIQTVKAVLAADLACDEADFDVDGVSIRQAEIRGGRFRFPIREQSLTIVTMGRGVVVSCNRERLEWARQALGNEADGQIFAARTVGEISAFVQRDKQLLAGPDQKYVCSSADLKDFPIPDGINLVTYKDNDIVGLYRHAAFKHALSFRSDSARSDRIATVAERGGTIIGIAGASEDCGRMWQIGVDVLPEYQGMGIGKAIVGTLTKAVLNEGIVPYYTTEVGNLRSRQLAASLGYWPAWIQMYAR
ncbi:GNAT family N-acetyltransferase [Paenibacillus arenilitoris]|uniref:GNAT family N-acetyltransferase n=1 Tax=Paenibacillus arenilitoris TaxID=2772299 RepID=A0A927CS95_9BACL|nr:GNAT family N-acetyltransferase [Paenibacillus arenilitoris]MBD2870971.1 GNAT family N-acetyltransferase [Paenibacillus arenilitoris]